MTTLEKFNFGASIVSVLSGIFSFIIFILNKTIRNELIKKREIESYTSFISNSDPVIEKIKKYSALNGKAFSLPIDKLINALKTYYELVHGIKKNLSKDGLITINDKIDNLKKFINDYTGKDNSVYRTNITNINDVYFMVIELQTSIKDILNNKLYR